MNDGQRLNRKGDKVYYYYDIGRGKGKRPSTGIFTHVKPKNQVEKEHNKEVLKILDVKKSQAILDIQSIGTPFIPKHKFNENFFDFYTKYVKDHKSEDNRHLPCSLTKFREFIGKDYISPVDITEDLCKRFRKFLKEKLTGETPQNYFAKCATFVILMCLKSIYFR